MLYLCIERMFGLTNGCRTLERICCRLATMILACSSGEVRENLKEREDYPFDTVAENQDILLRNVLEEDLVASVAKL